MDSLENKKMGDPVWILDLSDPKAKCGSIIEQTFVSWENRKVLTIYGSVMVIHDQNKVFASPTGAAMEAERMDVSNMKIKELMRQCQSTRKRRNNVDADFNEEDQTEDD